jgi:hypothetical protein
MKILSLLVKSYELQQKDDWSSAEEIIRGTLFEKSLEFGFGLLLDAAGIATEIAKQKKPIRVAGFCRGYLDSTKSAEAYNKVVFFAFSTH